jgi:hypothetical protein
LYVKGESTQGRNAYANFGVVTALFANFGVEIAVSAIIFLTMEKLGIERGPLHASILLGEASPMKTAPGRVESFVAIHA